MARALQISLSFEHVRVFFEKLSRKFLAARLIEKVSHKSDETMKLLTFFE